MTPDNDNSSSSDVFSPMEENSSPSSLPEEGGEAGASVATEPVKDAVQACDFRNPSLLSPNEMRKLRKHQDQFVENLASRLSVHLRAEFTLKLSRLQTVTYQGLAQNWADPSHLTLFKLEPVRGVGILEISPQLGSGMVDRLMGGPGQAPETFQELSEIEKALLDQNVLIVLEEWCGNWAKTKEFKSVLLGYESSGRFVQTAPAETPMLVLTLDASLADCRGTIRFGFPFIALETFIRQVAKDENIQEIKPAAAAPAAPVATKWNNGFDDLCLPITAEWNTLEITAGEVLNLKIGDVIKMTPQQAEQMEIRIGDLPKFNGRPGTAAGHWAVELTSLIRPAQ